MALANNTTPGSIVLAGDLTGNANAPELRPTGVVPGSYTTPNIVIDSKGRVVYAANSVIPFSGDVSGWSNANVLSLSGVTAGTYGNSTITVNAKGIITNISTTPTALSGDVTGTIASTVLASSGVVAGTYSSATVTVDAKGRVTNVTSPPVTLSGDVYGTPMNVQLMMTGVTPGVYTSAAFDIDAKGRVISAINAELSGDVTGIPGATVLSPTSVSPGSYDYPTITVDAKGRVTSIRGLYASYINKGLVQINDDGLDISAGVLSCGMATELSLGMATVDLTHLSVTAGAINTSSSVLKLNTGGTFTKAVGNAVEVAVGVYTPNLANANLFECATSSTIQAPVGTTDGDTFSFIVSPATVSVTGSDTTTFSYVGLASDIVMNPEGIVHLVIDGSIQYKDNPGDGGTGWTDITTIDGETINGAYSGVYDPDSNRYVVVSQNRGYVSSDGINWVKSSFTKNFTSNVMVHSGVAYAWVSSIGYKNTSGSNTTWDESNMGSGGVVKSAITAGNSYIAASNGKVTIGSIAVPSSYVVHTVGSFTPARGIIASVGNTVVIGRATGYPLVIPDISVPTFTNQGDINMISLWVANGIFFAFGWRDSTTGIYWSANGIEWTLGKEYGSDYFFAKGNYVFKADGWWGTFATTVAKAGTFTSHYKFSNTNESLTAAIANCIYHNGTSYCTYGGN